MSHARLFLPGEEMRLNTTCVAWAVYRMTLSKKALGGNVVCEQREWEAIEAAKPGYHTLLHARVATEQEAERLARGTPDSISTRSAVQKSPRVGIPFLTVTSTDR